MKLKGGQFSLPWSRSDKCLQHAQVCQAPFLPPPLSPPKAAAQPPSLAQHRLLSPVLLSSRSEPRHQSPAPCTTTAQTHTGLQRPFLRSHTKWFVTAAFEPQYHQLVDKGDHSPLPHPWLCDANSSSSQDQHLARAAWSRREQIPATEAVGTSIRLSKSCLCHLLQRWGGNQKAVSRWIWGRPGRWHPCRTPAGSAGDLCVPTAGGLVESSSMLKPYNSRNLY